MTPDLQIRLQASQIVSGSISSDRTCGKSSSNRPGLSAPMTSARCPVQRSGATATPARPPGRASPTVAPRFQRLQGL